MFPPFLFSFRPSHLLQEQAKMRMTKQKDSDITRSYWNNLWDKPKAREKSGFLRTFQQP